MTGGIFAMAIFVGVSEEREALAFGCVTVCALMLLYQINVSRLFWVSSMEPKDSPGK